MELHEIEYCLGDKVKLATAMAVLAHKGKRMVEEGYRFNGIHLNSLIDDCDAAADVFMEILSTCLRDRIR